MVCRRLRGFGWACALVLLVWDMSAAARTLRVCADPNNLPFSNDKGEGFENKIVALIAKRLDARVEYTWWAQRRGYARNTLKAQACDLWPGVARGVEMLATTEPYYRSTYVFVSRADRHLGDLDSFGDPRLESLTIGVQMIGNDAMNTPPAHALAERGITGNVRGYMLYGDYARPNPPAAIVDAVARGDIDVAIVWGPLAGYFAEREGVKLALVPVAAAATPSELPMAFDIAMGVRKNDKALRDELDRLLRGNGRAIDAILAAYHVPRLPIAHAPDPVKPVRAQ